MLKRQYQITIELEAENIQKGREEIGNSIGALGYKVAEIKHIPKTRTGTQNNALHLYFTQLAEALNDAGFDITKVIKVDIPWSCLMVKELLWKPTQDMHLGKKSTTQLTTTEIDKIFDIVNRAVGGRTKVYVPFPSIESLEESSLNKLR